MAEVPKPSNAEGRSANPLRPARLNQMIGQQRMRLLLRRVISAAIARDIPLDHMLLIGGSGVGKTTIANIVANELHVDCFQVEAPISYDTLLALAGVMVEQDVLFIDEIHQQAIMERRGKTSSTQPEVLYQVLEDHVIVTDAGVLPFPHITVIGATTDEGMLPDPFINRFPLRPQFDPYSDYELAQIALANAEALDVAMGWDAAYMFAQASRGVPRQINNYVRNGAMLDSRIDADVAHEVLADLNRVTPDGLTLDMQKVLIFLATKARHENGDGEVTYRASVSTLATAIGKARDTKAVQLRIEPYLIERGYLRVGHGGRSLTDEGFERAMELMPDKQ